MGDRTQDVKESGSTDVETHPKTSNAWLRSQRGHRSRSVGKPRTWGRTCAVRRNDGMGENPCWPYQEVSKPLGLSVVGRSAA
jgi:hypothetical protein